jgi:outer membrane receptor for ferrienterochelin and colicins
MRALLIGACVALMASWSLETSAQKTLRGKVFAPEDHSGHNHAPGAHVGKETFDPLPGATVLWKGSGVGTVTDAFGFFQLDVRRNPDTLRVSMVGYQSVDVLYNGESFLEVPLEPGVLLQSADVVFEERSQSVSLLNPLNIQQLSRKELCKAACCNLSEAFETNASVDASFTDAVTGTRQIHMLGLAGKYTQLLVDNLPGPRGLNVVQGMGFIPGPWIESIFISKGVGTVASGYESFTGQINVAHRTPDSAEPFHLNLFYGASGRMEFNHVSKHRVSRRWDTVLMTHGEYGQRVNDRNQDGFLDTPLRKDGVVRNEWRFVGDRGLRADIALTGVDMKREGGMVPNDTVATPWVARTEIQRAEVNAKVGYVLPGQEGRSWGSQWTASTHRHWHGFGNRTYDGQQNTFRVNVLRSGFLGSEDRQFSAGVSYLYDDFLERGTWGESPTEANPTPETWARTEHVPGAFLETTWTGNPRGMVVAGLRVDQHNLWGTVVTPRLHARWSATEQTSLKMVAGTGFRTPNVLMEELGVWASNRTWIVDGPLEPERGWNAGLNVTSKFKLAYRDADFALDGYWTEFQNRAVVDLDADAHAVRISNLGDRQSRSLTAQAELGWSVHHRVDMRLAYRYVHATTERDGAEAAGTLVDPYVPQHRAFTQWSYSSKANERGANWMGDLTVQWVGPQRIPRPDAIIDDRPASEFEDDFVVVNGQISRVFAPGIDLYLGVENILNYRQQNPIAAAQWAYQDEQMFQENMDASLVYGPIFGRMVYVGGRLTLGRADNAKP